jgi:hypothetical protein
MFALNVEKYNEQKELAEKKRLVQEVKRWKEKAIVDGLCLDATLLQMKHVTETIEKLIKKKKKVVAVKKKK